MKQSLNSNGERGRERIARATGHLTRSLRAALLIAIAVTPAFAADPPKDAAPKEETPKPKAVQASAKITVRDINLYVMSAYGNSLNNAALFKSTMPGFMSIRRVMAERKNLNHPSPAGLITFEGEPNDDVDVLLEFKNGKFFGNWPPCPQKSKRLLWVKAKLSPQKGDAPTLPENHWMTFLRESDRLWFDAGRRSERFILYDAELPLPNPLKVTLAEGGHGLANTSKFKLHDVTVYKPAGDQWVVGSVPVLEPPPKKEEKAPSKDGKAKKPDPEALFDDKEKEAKEKAAKEKAAKEKAEGKPAEEKKADEKKPDEKKSEEKKPEDGKAEEKKPEEKKSDEKKPEEKKAEEKKSDEQKADVKKSEEKKGEETKTEEKKADTATAAPAATPAPAAAAAPAVAAPGAQPMPGAAPADAAKKGEEKKAEEKKDDTKVVNVPSAKEPQGKDEIAAGWVTRLKELGLGQVEADYLSKQLAEQALRKDSATIVFRLDEDQLEEMFPLEVTPAPQKQIRVALVVLLDSDPDVAKRVEELVKKLGDSSYAEREAAMATLKKLGPAAKQKVQEAVNDKDAEIAYRAEQLVELINNPNAQAGQPNP